MGRKYKFKTKPYAHQARALKKLLANGWGGALLLEPRTGKTKVAIDFAAIHHLKGDCSKVLILCPVSVLGVWKREIAAHCPYPTNIIIWDRDGRKERPRLPDTPRRLTFVLMNYDAFSTPGKRSRTRPTGRYLMKKKVDTWKPDLIVLDESHKIKSPSAKKTRMIQGLKAPYKIIATGTPVTKKKRVFDVYAQWKFLNPARFADFKNFKEFQHYYGVWTQRNGFPQWLGNRNTDNLRKRLHEDSYSVKRSECFDLPPRTHSIIPISLSDSRPVYIEMAEEMIAKIRSGEITEASIKLVQGLRLAQITSGLAKTTPTDKHPKSRLVRIGTEKLDELEGLLDDLFEAEEKVVVAARFLGDIVGIRKRVSVPTYVLKGGMTRTERDSAINRFQTLPGPSLFIMQPQAGALGIDLSSASTMIWFSLTTSFVDFSQANDRIALSKRPCSYMYLLATGTVDEVLYQSLQEDRDVAELITTRPEVLLGTGLVDQ